MRINLFYFIKGFVFTFLVDIFYPASYRINDHRTHKLSSGPGGYLITAALGTIGCPR